MHQKNATVADFARKADLAKLKSDLDRLNITLRNYSFSFKVAKWCDKKRNGAVKKCSILKWLKILMLLKLMILVI